ncbi:hypothetical protein Nepgr_023799 [Nepenthes gracilis]|uniref:Uncharacterized protein n=1 Tax=Nepenthes gracilis TaxID=150966 RepID=A0AAD3T3H3_NEPGR|nr:hypothetical protein Nepgr_023799 [Nepenthes gracilis]
MGRKGRIPPHMRRSHPRLGMVYSEPFASAIRPPPGGLPPFATSGNHGTETCRPTRGDGETCSRELEAC